MGSPENDIFSSGRFEMIQKPSLKYDGVFFYNPFTFFQICPKKARPSRQRESSIRWERRPISCASRKNPTLPRISRGTSTVNRWESFTLNEVLITLIITTIITGQRHLPAEIRVDKGGAPEAGPQFPGDF